MEKEKKKTVKSKSKHNKKRLVFDMKIVKKMFALVDRINAEARIKEILGE